MESVVVVYILKPQRANLLSQRHAWCFIDKRDHPVVVRWLQTYQARMGFDRHATMALRCDSRPYGMMLPTVMAGRPILAYSSCGDPGMDVQFYSILTTGMRPVWSTIQREREL